MPTYGYHPRVSGSIRLCYHHCLTVPEDFHPSSNLHLKGPHHSCDTSPQRSNPKTQHRSLQSAPRHPSCHRSRSVPGCFHPSSNLHLKGQNRSCDHIGRRPIARYWVDQLHGLLPTGSWMSRHHPVDRRDFHPSSTPPLQASSKCGRLRQKLMTIG